MLTWVSLCQNWVPAGLRGQGGGLDSTLFFSLYLQPLSEAEKWSPK